MRNIFVANSVQHCIECALANCHSAHYVRPNALPHLLQVSMSKVSPVKAMKALGGKQLYV
jgi:hypothetical protein